MAIAHVHTDTTADTNGPGATINITLPTGGLASEICLLVIGSFRDNNATPAGSWTPPAGWTEFFTAIHVDQPSGFGAIGLQGFWSLANNTNLTFTKVGTVSQVGWCAVDFSGVDTTTPLDVTANTQSNQSSASLTVASITIVTDQAWDIILADDWNQGTVTITGFTVVSNAAAQAPTYLAYNTTPKSVGATGTATYNSGGAAGGQAIAAARVALRVSGASPGSGAPSFLLTA